MGRYSLGVVDVAFWPDRGPAAAERARALGFEHVDVAVDVDPATLALPVGCPTAFPRPVPGWCATPAPAAGEGRWEQTVARFRAAPGALLEPWAGACVHSVETVRAMAAEVPGLRFLIDTGHVADWGGDPCELLEWADHVQLRQGAPGRTQLHVDDPDGVVDFAAVLARLDALGYRGVCSVEHFDLPDLGWPLADPVGWADDLRRHVAALMD
ncbi:MAG: sugar phosphate isomerase/epimerase [Actinobacteria bacterium]|nr:sugar phosphate isomerase/epimerase [Actinomycetota bacterium]